MESFSLPWPLAADTFKALTNYCPMKPQLWPSRPMPLRLLLLEYGVHRSFVMFTC